MRNFWNVVQPTHDPKLQIVTPSNSPREVPAWQESSFSLVTAEIIPANGSRSNGHTEERVAKISSTIAPLLRCLGNLIENVEER